MELEFPTDADAVIVRPTGPFTLETAMQWAPALLKDPRFRVGMHQVYDLSGMEAENASFERVQRVVDELRERPQQSDALIAYVAPDDLLYGLVRMFIVMSGTDVPRRRNLFRKVEDALNWIREEIGMSRTGTA